MNLIELKDIVKTYYLADIDVPVLRGLSLSIAQGEYVALMGASGSGKSTLMNLIGCLDRPTSGGYWLDGTDVTSLDSDGRAMIRNNKIGFVFQNFNLLRRTSALDNVMMPLDYNPRLAKTEEGERRARELLKQVGLEGRFEHEPSQLSGGQQQRVAIARALINDPPILLADEPTGNLDSETTEQILHMLSALNKERGLTIVLVTHEDEVASRANRIIRLHDGKMISDLVT